MENGFFPSIAQQIQMQTHIFFNINFMFHIWKWFGDNEESRSSLYIDPLYLFNGIVSWKNENTKSINIRIEVIYNRTSQKSDSWV